MPVLILVAEIFNVMPLNIIELDHQGEVVELGLDSALGLTVIGEEAIISRGFVAAQARFLVHDQFGDLCDLRDGRVGLLDEPDGLIGATYLQIESPGGNQQGNDGKQEDLPQNSIELSEIHLVIVWVAAQ